MCETQTHSRPVTLVSVATFKSNIPLLLVDANSHTPSDYKSGQFLGNKRSKNHN